MSYRTITLIALFTAGCGTAISTTLINPAPRPMSARPPETVEIFSSGPPQRPYVDVAFLEAEQESHLSVDNTPEFINHLRVRAAAMGCDGVVLGGVTHAADVAASVAADVNASKKGITATCIVYLAESVAAAPPAPQVDPQAALPPAPPATVDLSSN
jgi:hypothetical protein